ncbi:SPRY domain-containing protein ASCRUDRAFT_72984 [Ascoidea rubescens DSM 1968]|uniref:B30.2/SPRY domain-containing protein n=1 Tax=Ascoidea rubescens DSM 1968 TaxID=1344418 RepID=A0A1D2V951_9ASCO|nr:hypothetical protein ASCRUDRAFT_72984 [Ascoidea rubescens DSM 1968]ODV57983.1 hypothetical protein ASCRUDRAFT_72984 [Ascoidea rubescens DSM 1968]
MNELNLHFPVYVFQTSYGKHLCQSVYSKRKRLILNIDEADLLSILDHLSGICCSYDIDIFNLIQNNCFTNNFKSEEKSDLSLICPYLQGFSNLFQERLLSLENLRNICLYEHFHQKQSSDGSITNENFEMNILPRNFDSRIEEICVKNGSFSDANDIPFPMNLVPCSSNMVYSKVLAGTSNINQSLFSTLPLYINFQPGQQKKSTLVFAADKIITPIYGLFYYEVRVGKYFLERNFSVGFHKTSADDINSKFTLNDFPGISQSSFAINSSFLSFEQTNRAINNRKETSCHDFSFQPDDVIGCGIDYFNSIIFFTKNGKFSGVAFKSINFPVIPVLSFSRQTSELQKECSFTIFSELVSDGYFFQDYDLCNFLDLFTNMKRCYPSAVVLEKKNHQELPEADYNSDVSNNLSNKLFINFGLNFDLNTRPGSKFGQFSHFSKPFIYDIESYSNQVKRKCYSFINMKMRNSQLFDPQPVLSHNFGGAASSGSLVINSRMLKEHSLKLLMDKIILSYFRQSGFISSHDVFKEEMGSSHSLAFLNEKALPNATRNYFSLNFKIIKSFFQTNKFDDLLNFLETYYPTLFGKSTKMGTKLPPSNQMISSFDFNPVQNLIFKIKAIKLFELFRDYINLKNENKVKPSNTQLNKAVLYSQQLAFEFNGSQQISQMLNRIINLILCDSITLIGKKLGDIHEAPAFSYLSTKTKSDFVLFSKFNTLILQDLNLFNSFKHDVFMDLNSFILKFYEHQESSFLEKIILHTNTYSNYIQQNNYDPVYLFIDSWNDFFGSDHEG